jgi:hypothetical protein
MCALIKYSAAVGAASGKAGGIVFARNKTGAYIRNWVNPVNPNTTKQQTTRTQFANLISGWKNLTKAQQTAWQDMTPQYPYTNRLGEASEYTGAQLYNHLNMNLQVVGATLLTTPLVPQTFSNTRVTGLTMTNTAGVLTTGDVTLQAVGASTESIIIEVTTSLSGGITKPAKGLFRFVQLEGDASSGTTIDISTAYIALYGSPELGATVFVRAWLINENTGQRMNLGQESAIVTGT